MKERMKFEEFKNVVGESIISWLPENFRDARVNFQVVTKNNNLKLTGMVIMLPNKNIAPTIYLESFYEKYQNGEEMDGILEQIAKIQLEHDTDLEFDTKSVTELERCKDKIFPRLISTEWNRDILETCPYVEMEDLAVVFYIDLSADERGRMSIKIHNGLMEMWNLTVEELYEISVSNLQKEHSGTFRAMNEVVAEMMLTDVIEEYDGDVEEAKRMVEAMMPENNVMYVLSNESKVHGASIILDNEMMERVIDRVGEDFYILPSSIHELLVVPANSHMKIEELKNMVYEVNTTQVAMEERLSNNVYRYNLIKGIQIA